MPAVAIAFEADDVATFGSEVAALAELRRIGAGPRLLDIVQAEDAPDGQPTLVEEDVGASLEEVILSHREIPMAGGSGTDGVTLASLGTRKRELQNAKILLDVYTQVSHMHEAGCYHGDLKLSNVCLRATGPEPRDLHATIIDIERRLSDPDAKPPRLTPLYLDAMFRELPTALGHEMSVNHDLPPVFHYDLACLEAIRFEVLSGCRIATQEGDRLRLNMDEAYLNERFGTRAKPLFAYDRQGNPRVRPIRRERDLAPLASKLGIQLEAARKQRTIAVGVALVALVMLVMGIALARAVTQPVPEAETPWVDDEPGRTVVSLAAQDDLPYAAIKGSVEELRARLDHFFGAGGYQMAVHGDEVTLSLPSDAFDDNEWEGILYSYFVRPIELYAYNYTGSTPDHYSIERNAEHIDRSNIVSVDTTGEGKVEIRLDKQAYGMASKMGKEEGELRLELDVGVKGGDVYCFPDVELDDNERMIRIMPDADDRDPSLDKRLSDALVFALSREPMPGSFDVTIEPHVDWHAFDEEETQAEHRVSPAEIGGDAGVITVSLGETSDYDEDFLQEDLQDIRDVLCARLDAMEVPYALGKVEGHEKDTAVLLSIEYVGWPVSSLLGIDQGADNAYLIVGLDRYYVKSAQLQKGASGPKLTCAVEDEQRDDLQKALAKAKDAPAYLSIRGYPLLVAKASDLAKDKNLSFKKTCFDAAADGKWLFALIDTVLNGPRLPMSLYVESEFTPRNSTANDHALSLGIAYDTQLADLFARVKEVVPDATASATGTSVTINFHMDVDETLPEQILTKVKRIYKDIDFEHSVFDTVSFWPCDWRAGERASIHFQKENGASFTRTEPYVYLFGSFHGGRFERYKEDFSQRFFADEFYQSFDDGEFSFFQLE